MSEERRDKIRALSDREQAREKLPIFYGSRDNYLHGFKEVLGNAVDEINNNYKKGIIKVNLHSDLETITVSDTGRGIPITGETDGVRNDELLFETLFAGTNYDNADFDKIAVGTNGVGATVLNFTSELFKVTSVSNGVKNRVVYSNGGSEKIVDPETEAASEKAHGSIFTFKLDKSVYTKTKYKPEEIKDIVKRTAATANKVTFKFVFEGETTEFYYPSLQAYYEEVAHQLTAKPVVGPLQKFTKGDERNEIQILFSTSSDPVQESYLNHNWLPEMGSIHDGIIQGVKNFVNKYLKDNKLLPKGSKNLITSDVEDSVSYVASMMSANVEYANQTKLSTDKTLYKTIANDYVKGLMEAYQAEQPKQFEKFAKHILSVHKFNNKNSAAKKKLKKKLNEKVEGIGNKVDKLVDCEYHNTNSELFIAEGASALGSIVMARDSNYQAAYALRGKILNCLKADYTKIFSNDVILDLVKVLGCGIETDKKNKDLGEFDIKKLRFGKVVIATDADSDGQQIACLIITMFYRLMPELIKQGRIFVAQTPLYELKHEDDSMTYFFSEKEKDEKLSEVKGKYTIQRCKGLGELEAQTMADTAMDKDTRNIVQVTVEDAESMNDMIEMFMGTDGSGRKQYIEDNLYKYIDEAKEV